MITTLTSILLFTVITFGILLGILLIIKVVTDIYDTIIEIIDRI